MPITSTIWNGPRRQLPKLMIARTGYVVLVYEEFFSEDIPHISCVVVYGNGIVSLGLRLKVSSEGFSDFHGSVELKNECDGVARG